MWPGDGGLSGIDNFKIAKSLPGTVSVNFTANLTEVTSTEAVSFLPFVSGGNAPYTYLWGFGNRIYTYTVPGNYTVTLMVDDSSGNQGENIMPHGQKHRTINFFVIPGRPLPSKSQSFL